MNTRTKTMSIPDRRTTLGAALITVTLLMLCWLLPTSAQSASAVNPSARSSAMGGAFTGLAEGVDAARYNPANLGLEGYRQNGLELASFGASITNNSFTLADYNNYTGATLSTADKQDIMNKIPTEGLSFNADVEVSALSLAMGNFALSFSGIGSADINLNRDIVDLILNGNTIADTIDISGSYSDGLTYASAGLSYGHPIYSKGTRQLAIGATFRYIRGVGVEQLVEMEGLATTFMTGYQGQGSAVIRTASGGTGYGLDLGAAFKLNDTYTAGVRLENLIGSINWSKQTEEHGYTFEFDTATVDDFDEDIVTSDDYTMDIAGFSTRLPASMNIGFAKHSGRFLWAVDWTQGFNSVPGTSTKPQLSIGTEYRLLSFLPARFGFSTGGDQNTAFSFGTGLKFFGFYMDMAILTGGSLSVYSAKGANLAFSTGLQF